MKENIKGQPGNRKPDGRKVQSPNKKPNPVAYEYTDEEYRRLLVKKQTEMEKLLSGFAPVDPIVGMENPYYYRNKVCAEFRKLKNGTIISGRYQEGTHNVIETKGCKIEDQRADAIIQDITGLFRSFKMMIYNEDSGYGLIRHVLIRTAHQTGQIMVIIVTASPVFPSKKNFANALLKLHPEIITIVQNINTKDTNMVLGDRNQVIYGKGYIEDVLCGKRFRLSPGSFYQINSVQTEKLYNKAIKYADLKKKETVIDAYCGIGTIGLIKSINTFNPEKNIKLATYASRCIENEILMYLRRNNKTKLEVSIDEPLNVDWDGNELLLSDILGTDEDVIYRDIETEVEKKLLNKAIEHLSGRERTIIELRFGINSKNDNELTQKEVADLLGISQSYISRLEKKIMKRLKKEIVRFE